MPNGDPLAVSQRTPQAPSDFGCTPTTASRVSDGAMNAPEARATKGHHKWFSCILYARGAKSDDEGPRSI